jgi:hypothetical protein
MSSHCEKTNPAGVPLFRLAHSQRKIDHLAKVSNLTILLTYRRAC